MRKINVEISAEEHDSLASLDDQGKLLLKKSREVIQNAYAPYSRFKVACSVLLSSGEIITGTNQENAAYPSGLCAERVALFSAMSQYPNAKVLALGIIAQNESDNIKSPISPCGSCRQVIAEYEKKQSSTITLYLQGSKDGKILKINSNKDLLPFAFDSDFLK
jgi:cytidine deaminase